MVSDLQKINFAFWGTPDVASETLEILKNAGYIPTIIITSPDARSGRKMLLTPPPTKIWAEANNIPYLQPEKLNPELTERLLTLGLELSIVVAYGKIMPKEILDLPKRGSINIHYSLLPKYRGASPVESAILHGETETGVSIQQMEYKMDAGPILAVEKTDIFPDEKASELRSRLIKIGGELLVKTIPDLIAGKINPASQNENEATHSKKIKKEDGLIDPEGDGVQNYNKFRAYATWPRTFFFKEERRVVITDAALEDGKLIIKKIIPEGGKEIEYKN